MNEQQKKLLQVLTSKHSNLYDYICDNYYLLTKEELKDLCKEAFALLYRVYENGNPYGTSNEQQLYKDYLENLKEFTTFFEE